MPSQTACLLVTLLRTYSTVSGSIGLTKYHATHLQSNMLQVATTLSLYLLVGQFFACKVPPEGELEMSRGAKGSAMLSFAQSLLR